jgi:hypothetical protein
MLLIFYWKMEIWMCLVKYKWVASRDFKSFRHFHLKKETLIEADKLEIKPIWLWILFIISINLTLKEKRHKNTVRNFIQVDLRDSQELEFLLSAIKVIQINRAVDIPLQQACHISPRLQYHMAVLSQAQQ